jgi:thymidylate kinase
MKNLAKELKKLLDTAIKEREEIPQTNYFGEDNWDDMDLEISILEEAVKDPTPERVKILIDDCEAEIEDIEDKCDDNDEEAYTKMDRTRSMYQELADTLRGLL